MASSSTPSIRPEWEPANTCQEMAPSSSSGPSMESNLMASTSTSGRKRSHSMAFNSATGCFQEIAPCASTSGASASKPVYDVFINHRGPDVKKTLAAKIYKTLQEMKVKAFLDEKELEYGDFLPETLETVIRGATLHIAILSKSYAKSVWCLAELSCMLQSGAKIVPIFYHVDPNDVRYVASGAYANDFQGHVEKGRYSPEKLKEWKHALYKVSFYSGEIIKNTDDEVRLLKNIVYTVEKALSNVPLVVARYPVGLTQVVEDFDKTLNLYHGEQRVQIIGIWGMGGLGKTTLAKELYNKRFYSMDKSSFIPDIRESKGVLHQKQNQLLKDLGVNQSADDVEHGKAILAKHLRCFRVLIVMDDVDNSDQLDALIPAKESLVSGSLIIITTRELEALTSWGISSEYVYKMKTLNSFDAKELFCWHAFLQSSPFHGFEGLVEKFVENCSGLPLPLKLFGGQLYGRDKKQYWESLFEKIRRVLSTDIKETLKISYDVLDHEEKEAFLDTACYFIGKKKSLVIEVWEGSRWSGLYTCERLVNKCLIEIDAEDYIRMHDHLRDLGRDIASQHSTSRLWFSDQIINYTKENKIFQKRNGIRGITAVSTRWERLGSDISGEVLSLAPYLVGLKFLVISGHHSTQIISEVSRDLLWLHWSDIGQSNLPIQFSFKNMRVLHLSGGHLEELWTVDSQAPTQLRELEILSCRELQRLPNSIGCLNQLRKMVLTRSKNLENLPEEFCHLRLLEHLDLQQCDLLSSLPSSFGDLTNLQYLDLQWCRRLKCLPYSFKNLVQLQYLDLLWCDQLILRSDDFQNIAKLEVLQLNFCLQLKELPCHITNQVSLRKLGLFCLDGLREIKIGHLRRLQKLKIGGKSLISLPSSLGDSASLINLEISFCGELKSLPASFKNLPSLTDLSIQYCHKLKSLLPSIENLSSLTRLSIDDCRALESLPNSLGNLFSLTHLLIKSCYKLVSLPASLENLSSLTSLEIVRCPMVKCLPFSVGRHNLLEHLSIRDCPISQVSLEAAPLSSATSNLRKIRVNGTKVCMISISEHQYPHLESLHLDDNDALTEIEALPVKLECLRLRCCPELKKLPSLERLTSLRKFRFEDCDQIGKIEGLEGCTRLETLSVMTSWEVPGIESLKGMGNLKNVELRANKGSAIESSIRTIQDWPDEIIIYAGTHPDACSVIDSFKLGLSPSLRFIDSSEGDCIMLCCIINRPSASSLSLSSGDEEWTQLEIGNGRSSSFVDDEEWPNLEIGEGTWVSYLGFCTGEETPLKIGEGRWALIIFSKHTTWLDGVFGCYRVFGKVEVETGFAVRGERKMLVEAILPLLQSIWR